MSRERLTRGFLWLSVIGWGTGLGRQLQQICKLGLRYCSGGQARHSETLTGAVRGAPGLK
jgi:hypothetical protein